MHEYTARSILFLGGFGPLAFPWYVVGSRHCVSDWLVEHLVSDDIDESDQFQTHTWKVFDCPDDPILETPTPVILQISTGLTTDSVQKLP
jgi:hypothetical protein